MSRPIEDLAHEFNAALADDAVKLGSSYNVAPTQQIGVVLERADDDGDGVRRELHAARWGLVPSSWAKDMSKSGRMINARLETAETKPAYRKPLASRRCLLPADGYYEWKKLPGGGKQPYFIHPADGGLVAMAGLFEWWPDPAVPVEDPAHWILSTTVLTTEPTAAPAEIHDRMPAMLPIERAGEWLDRANADVADLKVMLTESTAAIAEQLHTRPVSTAVNRVGINHPGLLERVELPGL